MNNSSGPTLPSTLSPVIMAPLLTTTMTKVLAMTILGVGSFILGTLPIVLARRICLDVPTKRNQYAISLLLCFGGGVLLFTTFLHLLPEITESFAYLEQSGRLPSLGHGISTAHLVFCAGFFFVYLIEEVVHNCLDADHGGNMKLQNIQQATSGQNSAQSSTTNSQTKLEISSLQVTTSNHHHHHHHHIPLETGGVKSSFSGLLAVVALSFHAVFEGLAVGLEADVTKVWYLFAAIATHKFVIAFCVGVELVTSKTIALLVVVYMATFAAVTPLGIGIGIVMSNSADGGGVDISSVVLQGMAAGTLLYVVFFEVLAREKNNSGPGDLNGVWKLLAILVGFTVMVLLQMATGHEHSHDHSHDEVDVTTTPGAIDRGHTHS